MLTGWRLTLSKCFLIPQRYVLGIMGFLAIVNAYTMRGSLSVAITEMTYDDDDDKKSRLLRLDDSDMYDWDSETQGLILGGFYWGYVITHLPGGIIAEKFGGKYSLVVGIFWTSLLTMLTPWVIRTMDWQGLLVLRVLEGLGEGTTYPALNTLLSKWVPASERAKIGTLVYAGGQIGTIVGNVVTGYLIEGTNSWAAVFYVFGAVGAAWCVFFVLLCYSYPEDHPFISDAELEFLQKELGHYKKKERLNIPWKAIFSSVPLWALVAAQIGHDWGFFTMVTDLPKFMKDVLDSDIVETGVMSSIPYVVMWIVSMGSGWLCDWLIARKYMTVTFARKFFTGIAAVGPGIFLVAASYAGTDTTVVITLFTIGMGFMGTFYCGMKVNALDLSPNYSGTLMAITNGIGAITGIITPYLVGVIVTDKSVDQWRIVFWISLGVFLTTTVLYTLFGSGQLQWWNDPQSGPEDIKTEDLESAAPTGPEEPVITEKPAAITN